MYCLCAMLRFWSIIVVGTTITHSVFVPVQRHSANNLRKFRIGCDGGGYGCWFYMSHTSNALLELKRAKEFNSKNDAIAWINARTNRSSVLHFIAKCAAHYAMHAKHDRNIACGGLHHSESGICLAATSEGYDSVIIQDKRELVSCHPWCLEHVSCVACVPILSAHNNVSCNCSSRAVHVDRC